MKKTIMPHNLAKALMEASMQHFDDGGAVGPAPSITQGGTPPISGVGAQAGQSPVLNPSNYILPAANSAAQSFAQPAIDAVESGAGQLGGAVKNIAASFTAQNGYNAQLAPEQKSNYQGIIDAAAGNSFNGIPQYNQNIGLQNNLAQQLIRQSQGKGPNPAQAALNQNTGQNVANTAALIASARGASANPGLAARNAAMAGAGVQQNAVGQAATLQAQQQLDAQKQAGNVYGQIGNQIQGEQGVQNNLFGSAVAGQNTQNANEISNYGQVQGINSQVAQNNANAVNKNTAGLMGGIGSLGGLLYKGGVVPSHMKSVHKIYHGKKYADGGSVAPIYVPNLANDAAVASTDSGFSQMGGGKGGSGGGSGGGGGGGMSSMLPMLAMLASGGGSVPGKDRVPGKNSPKNDVVPAMLSPKEVVLPLSVTQSADPVKKAAEFMAHLMGEDRGYGKVAKAKRRCAGGRV